MEAPVVGTVVDVTYDKDEYIHIQSNNPIVNVPDDVNYYVEYDATYWYVGEDFDYFEGAIEKNTKYNAIVYVNSIEEWMQFADDLVVYVNGEEVTDFYNMEFWVDVLVICDSHSVLFGIIRVQRVHIAAVNPFQQLVVVRPNLQRLRF